MTRAAPNVAPPSARALSCALDVLSQAVASGTLPPASAGDIARLRLHLRIAAQRQEGMQ